MVTITTTIRDPVFSPYLEQRAYIHQKVLRKLFVAIYIEGENPNEAYNRLAAAHGIFAAGLFVNAAARDEVECATQRSKHIAAANLGGLLTILRGRSRSDARRAIRAKRTLYISCHHFVRESLALNECLLSTIVASYNAGRIGAGLDGPNTRYLKQFGGTRITKIICIQSAAGIE